ncbi:MAG TPA: YIP1 family protein [Syntrophales bacterium]|nr:YIP1 family protein [Syntrophales bacterium]
MSSYTERLIGASRLDAQIYEEVEHDTGSMGQAAWTVVLASFAAGIGALSQGGASGLLLGAAAALAGWLIWAYLTYYIGSKFLGTPETEVSVKEMMRTIGFSSSPGLIRVLGIIPGLAGLVYLVSALWMLAAMVVAVRQALDYTSTMRAVAVCIIGWIVQAVVLALFIASFRP